jgi:cell division protein FtsB
LIRHSSFEFRYSPKIHHSKESENSMRSHPFAKSLGIVVGGLLFAGCTAQDLQQLQQARAQTVSELDQAQATQTQLRQSLTTLPADDPIRKELEPKLDELDALIQRLQGYVPVLDGAIQSLSTSQVDPTLQQAAAAIPYGSLVLAALSLAFGVVKHVQAGNLSDQEQQAQKAFAQIVAAMDAALPTPNADQKAAVDSALDSDVKAKVAAARA